MSELKDFKLRESRLLTENNELDEENISLQKQVSILKSSQVDIETYKVEIESLQGIVETLQIQIEENKNLKQIAEKQVNYGLLEVGYPLFDCCYVLDARCVRGPSVGAGAEIRHKERIGQEIKL